MMPRQPHGSASVLLPSNGSVPGLETTLLGPDSGWARGMPEVFVELANDCAEETFELFQRVIDAASDSLRQELRQIRGKPSNDQMASALELPSYRTLLASLMPAMLKNAISRACQPQESDRQALPQADYYSLSLVDETGLQQSVDLANALQLFKVELDDKLGELNSLVCSARGFRQASLEDNPLRPETYLRAFQAAIAETGVRHALASAWFARCSMSLAPELEMVYQSVIRRLKQAGVQRAEFEIGPTRWRPPPRPESTDSASAAEAPARKPRPVRRQDRPRLLYESDLEYTSQRLAQLGGVPNAQPATPKQNWRVSRPGNRLLLSLEQLQWLLARDAASAPAPLTSAPAPLTTGAAPLPPAAASPEQQELEQLLASEVVRLLVENILKNRSILYPVRGLISELEPALRGLCAQDPVFFSNPRHPARALLDALASRSMAFHSELDAGFDEFMLLTHEQVHMILAQPQPQVHHFEAALHALHQTLTRQEGRAREQRHRAVEVLERAQQRNALARDMASTHMKLPGIERVSSCIVTFLHGPWAQVMAHARINGVEAPYQQVAETLVWSVKPSASKRSHQQLVNAIPWITDSIRSGLALLDIPARQTEGFFKDLLALHLNALKESQRADARESAPTPIAPLQIPKLQDSLWLAPAERKAVGLVEARAPHVRRRLRRGAAHASDAASSWPGTNDTLPNYARTAPQSQGSTNFMATTVLTHEELQMIGVPAPSPSILALGNWFEIVDLEKTYRAKLTWINSQSTLLLLSKPDGTTASMQMQSFSQKLKLGTIRQIVSGSVVETALEALTAGARQNSDKGLGGLEDSPLV